MIENCYENIGGNYKEALKRFQNPVLVQRFALKFLDDTTYDELKKYIEDGNVDEAFRAAHTLKGLSRNLAFAELDKSSSEITEILRAKKLDEAKKYFSNVKKDYELIVSELNKLK